jgi:hypothetical protein
MHQEAWTEYFKRREQDYQESYTECIKRRGKDASRGVDRMLQEVWT